MSVIGLGRLVRDLERVDGLIAEMRHDPPLVLSRYPLSPIELNAVLDLDAEALIAAGLNALPMRNLVTLLGVPNSQIYTHHLSLRTGARSA